MTTLEANIDITRNPEGILKSVSLALPVWTKESEDGFLSVNIPILGIKTFAKDEADVDSAIKEAITLFCLNAEDFGNGLENELKMAGWNSSERKFHNSSLYWATNDDIIDLIIETGSPYSETLELTA
ncbi:hypothetical protein SAMN04489724_0680 [Algoriphagus locisalis]|uniref:Uncharacterized protein n=1 Tax=Algoriphagus locisalis TaxID=305507 RepID=A0A1I6XVW8_9BACT|nr:hypothetical protein [Algoriphagus locisalis]SFT42112.1 hypothetical protein SAMN04489724_0680 [Algoriphagus locisalis]